MGVFSCASEYEATPEDESSVVDAAGEDGTLPGVAESGINSCTYIIEI